MRKRNILVLLVFLFVVVLTSCSGLGSDTPSSGDAPGKTSYPTSSATAPSAQSYQGNSNSNVSRSYTITFDANGGIFDSGLSKETITVSEGDYVDYKKPSRDNDEFLFYVDSNYNKWDFGSAVNVDTVFKAVWESDFLVLSNYLGLEKDTNDSFTLIIKKSTISLDLSEVIKIKDKCDLSVYFENQAIDETINLNNYSSLSNFDIFVHIFNSQIKQEIVYTIHLNIVNDEELFKINYYVDGEVVKTKIVQAGLNYDITYVPTDSSRTFNCWLDSSNNKVQSVTPTSDIDLYAKFNSDNCIVTLDPKGGTIDTKKVIVTDVDSYTLPVPVKDNNRFLGWSYSGTYYSNDQGESVYSLEGKKSITLIAMWESTTINQIDDGYLVYVYYSNKQGYLVKGLGSNNPTDVIIPETYNDLPVVGIAAGAFQNDTIDRLVLPSSIELVGNAAVYGATIDKVYYNGTLAQWSSIEFDYTSINSNSFYILNESGSVDYLNKKYEQLTELFIPKEITKINPYAFSNFSFLESIVAESKDLECDSAFVGCSPKYVKLPLSNNNSLGVDLTNLEYVEVTNGEVFGSYTFKNASNLKTLVIPATLKTMKTNGFLGTNIETIYYNGSIGDWINIDIEDGTKTSPMEHESETNIDFYILDNNGTKTLGSLNYKLLTELVIPNGVKEIKNYSFLGFGQIKKMVLPDSIEAIGKQSFKEVGITEIEIPATLKSIDNGAFYGTLIQKANVPAIAIRAVETGVKLNTLIVNSGEEITVELYDSLKYVSLPKSLKRITSTARFNSLDELYYDGTLEDWVKIEFATYYCNPLGTYSTTLYILSENGDKEFDGKKYTNDTYLDILLEINDTDQNYYSYSGLTINTLKLLKNNETCSRIYSKKTIINDTTFYASSVIKNSEEVSFVGERTMYFIDSQVKVVEFDKSVHYTNFLFGRNQVTDLYYNGSIYDWMNVEIENDFYCVPFCNNLNFYVLNNESGTKEHNGKKYDKVQDLNIDFITPTDITSINYYQFYMMDCFNSITIGENITSIDTRAFANCNIDKLIILAPNLTLENDSFELCKYVEITTPSYVLPYVKSDIVKKAVITSGDSIPSGEFSARSFESITLPDTLKTINVNAFSGSSIKEIKLPKSLMAIGNDAFNGCDYLEKAYYDGSITDWAKVILGNSYSNPMCCANLFYSKENNSTEYSVTNKLVIHSGFSKVGNFQYYKFNQIEEIEINTSVTEIGNSSFMSCKNLTKVNLNEGLEKIGTNAFNSCPLLYQIIIPSTVTEIGEDAFVGCDVYEIYNYSSLNIVAGNFDNGGIASYAGVIHNVDDDSVLSVDDDGYVFAYVGGKGILVRYIGNDHILNLPTSFKAYDDTVVDSYSLGYHVTVSEKIYSITIPSCVTSIDIGAFYNHTVVELINKSMRAVNGLFHPKLQRKSGSATSSVVIENDFVFIEIDGTNYLVDYIGNDSEIILPDGYTYNSNYIDEYSIGENAFRYNNVKSKIILSDSVVDILNNSVQNLSREVYNYYENCYYLGTVDNPYLWLVKSDGNITKVHPDCKKIAMNVVGGNVTEILIPSTVEYISEGAFIDGIAVETIKLPFIGDKKRESTDTTPMYLGYVFGTFTDEFIGANPDIIQYRYKANNYYIPNTLKTVIIDGCDYIYVYAFSACTTLENIIFTGSTTEISNMSIYNAGKIANLYIGKDITKLGYFGAYENDKFENVYYEGTLEDWCNISINTSNTNPMYYADNFYILDENGTVIKYNQKFKLLTELIIPNSVENISSYAFYHFGNVTTVTMPDNVKTIGDNAFRRCTNLQSITLSSSLSAISVGMLAECTSLTSLHIGKNIETIESLALYNCSNLEMIEYEGTMEEWNNITKASDWNYSTGLTSIVCSDGTINI